MNTLVTFPNIGFLVSVFNQIEHLYMPLKQILQANLVIREV